MTDFMAEAPPSVSPPVNMAEHFEVLLVTGLSGAGMSTALQVLEDLNFFTADGLPPETLPDFCELFRKPGLEHYRGVALGVDFRRGATMDELARAMSRIRSQGWKVALIYLEALPEVIRRRYATTRRPHPLEREGLDLESAMQEEARRMKSVRASADLVLDTSSFSLHDLRRHMQQRWREEGAFRSAMRINLVSFGFKYGVPAEADMVFDLRFLPNPYFDPALRPLSGKDAAVAEYVFQSPEAVAFRDRFLDFLLFMMPLYDAEGRYRLTIGIGCTGGRHRSVALTELTARVLSQAGYSVRVAHRHFDLG